MEARQAAGLSFLLILSAVVCFDLALLKPRDVLQLERIERTNGALPDLQVIFVQNIGVAAPGLLGAVSCDYLRCRAYCWTQGAAVLGIPSASTACMYSFHKYMQGNDEYYEVSAACCCGLPMAISYRLCTIADERPPITLQSILASCQQSACVTFCRTNGYEPSPGCGIQLNAPVGVQTTPLAGITIYRVATCTCKRAGPTTTTLSPVNVLAHDWFGAYAGGGEATFLTADEIFQMPGTSKFCGTFPQPPNVPQTMADTCFHMAFLGFICMELAVTFLSSGGRKKRWQEEQRTPPNTTPSRPKNGRAKFLQLFVRK